MSWLNIPLGSTLRSTSDLFLVTEQQLGSGAIAQRRSKCSGALDAREQDRQAFASSGYRKTLPLAHPSKSYGSGVSILAT